MQLTLNKLKQLIKEVIEEGKQERQWISQRPEEEKAIWHSAEQQGMKVSDMSWIVNVKQEEELEDIIPFVIKFRNPQIQQKLKDNGMSVDLNINNYPTTDELAVKVSDAEEILKQNKIKKDPNDFYKTTFKDQEQIETLGKVGNWTILYPKTKEGSISSDFPRNTSWCTTKSDGQNLFDCYKIRSPLIYVNDYTRTPNFTDKKDLDSRLSIGFNQASEPILNGKAGSESVDSNNDGLTKEKLKNILGDNYEEIMRIATEKAREIKMKGNKNVGRAAKSLIFFKNVVKDYESNNAAFYASEIVKSDQITHEVYKYIFRNFIVGEYQYPNLKVQDLISSKAFTEDEVPQLYNFLKQTGMSGHGTVHAEWDKFMKNPKIPLNIIEDFIIKVNPKDKYTTNEMKNLRSYLIENSSLNLKFMEDLLDSGEKYTIQSVLKNKNITSEIIRSFLNNNDLDESTLSNIARNLNTPIDILRDLYEKYKQKGLNQIIYSMMANDSTPVDIVKEILKSFPNLITQLAKETSKPEYMQLILKSDNEEAKQDLCYNENVTPEIVVELFKQNDPETIYYAVASPKMPKEILSHLYNSEDSNIRASVAQNPNTPIEILLKLINDPDEEVRETLSYNPTFQAYENNNIQERKIKKSKNLANPIIISKTQRK